MPIPVPDPAAYLCGRWRIRRSIADGTRRGTFTGTATFVEGDTAQPPGLRYREDGVLELGGHRGRAYRELTYLRAADGVLAVTFSDGRPFHDLDLRDGTWRAHHPCRADGYDGTFTVLSADHWRQVWRVRGPAKDQLIATDFHRA